MSSNSVQLASALLGELFCEPIVTGVGRCLLNKNRALTAKQLATETGLPTDKVGLALCVLVQHGMVTFGQHKNGHVEYAINLKHVLSIGRYSHYIQFAKTRYGETAELLVSDLILHGSVTMSGVIHKVTAKLNEAIKDNGERLTASVAFEKFVTLASDRLVKRWPNVIPTEEAGGVPEFSIQSNLYAIPEVNLRMIEMRLKDGSDATRDEDGASTAKRRRNDDTVAAPMPDDGIYWRVDFDRFEQFMRDRLLISALERALDRPAAEVVASILRMAETQSDEWAPSTNPTSHYDIERELMQAGGNTAMLKQYLTLLIDDKTGYVSKLVDSQGGMYKVNYKEAIFSLTVSTIDNIVQERFGSKCLRLFRLIRQKKYLEQKQIEDMAMFPAKDAKEMTYRMLSKGFVHVKEISRTPDHAPSRTFYLFHVDLTMVVRSVLEWCHKFAVNLMVRREHENGVNKRLSEKEQRVAVILASVIHGGDDAQLQEVKELITPAEQAQLTRLKHVCRKLELGELQLDETTFVLQLYLRYHG